jgi:hypothetical protein
VNTVRFVLLALHIVAAGLWISQFIAERATRVSLKDAEGHPNPIALMMQRGRVIGMLGSIGGPLILLTGLGLLAVNGYAFLGIGGYTPLWLFAKQIIALVALAIVFIWIQPADKRLSAEFAAAAKVDSRVTPEMLVIDKRMAQISHINNLLVLINIVLAVWKPT